MDPYGIHEQRWMSAGRPTNLVRDAGKEAQDQPPDSPPQKPLVPAPVVESTRGSDLLRADDADRGPSPDLGSYADVAMDANALLNNPLTEGVLSSGPPGGVMFETPFERKMRQRSRRERWAKRWHKLFGGSQSKQ
jgi:hypothetical protein